jgi:hypothetical protein
VPDLRDALKSKYHLHPLAADLRLSLRRIKADGGKSLGTGPPVSGAPGETRTPDPLLRRQTLYPTELRALRQL